MALTAAQRKANEDYKAGRISDREYAKRYMGSHLSKDREKDLSDSRNTKTNTTTRRTTSRDDDDDRDSNRNTNRNTTKSQPKYVEMWNPERGTMSKVHEDYVQSYKQKGYTTTVPSREDIRADIEAMQNASKAYQAGEITGEQYKAESDNKPLSGWEKLNQMYRDGELSQREYAKLYMEETLGKTPSEDLLNQYSDDPANPYTNEQVNERMLNLDSKSPEELKQLEEVAHLERLIDELGNYNPSPSQAVTGIEAPTFEIADLQAPTQQDFGLEEIRARIQEMTELQKQQLIEEAMAVRDQKLASLNQEESSIDPMYDRQEQGVRAQSRRAARNFQEFLATRGLADSGSAAQAQIAQNTVTQGTLGDIAQQEASDYADIARRRQGAQSEFATNKSLAAQKAMETRAVAELDELKRQREMQFTAAQQQAQQQFEMQRMAVQNQYQQARDRFQMQYDQEQARLDRQFQARQQQLQALIRQAEATREFERAQQLQRQAAEENRDYMEAKAQIDLEASEYLRGVDFKYDKALEQIRTQGNLSEIYARGAYSGGSGGSSDNSDVPEGLNNEQAQLWPVVEAIENARAAGDTAEAKTQILKYRGRIITLFGEDFYNNLKQGIY